MTKNEMYKKIRENFKELFEMTPEERKQSPIFKPDIEKAFIPKQTTKHVNK